jgi:anti-sigma B factor antagonist
VNDPLAFVETKQLNGQTIVRLKGELDLSNVDYLQDQLAAAVETAPDVVVELAGLQYLDSQGLRLIKHLSDKAHDCGGKLVVVAPPESFARQVLEMSNLNAYVTIRDGLED